MDAQRPSWQMRNGFCTTVLYTTEVWFIDQRCNRLNIPPSVHDKMLHHIKNIKYVAE